MAATITIKGTYSQKTEIFGITISHHTGSFDFSKPIGSATWTQSFGPVHITESFNAADDDVVVTVSAFGLSETVFKGKVVVKENFKIELDSGNEVVGTVSVSDPAPAAEPTPPAK